MANEPITIRVCSHHIARPGYVFIEYHPRSMEDSLSWRRARLDVVNRRGWQDRIIRCIHCDQPAVRLDHLWPYFSEMNACAEHIEGKS